MAKFECSISGDTILGEKEKESLTGVECANL